MIILDIETTGVVPGENGVWQIGALNLNKPGNYFLQECKVDNSDVITEGAFKVHGRTEERLLDKNLQSQEKMISNYLDWVEKQSEKVFCGQNVAWDISMIQARTIKYGMHDRFLEIHGQRGYDLHTLAQDKYFELNKEYFLKENGMSKFNLGEILKFCGIPDNRRNVRGYELVKEGSFHNALEDCRLEGECYSRIKFGKGIFNEFFDFDIPDYLKRC